MKSEAEQAEIVLATGWTFDQLARQPARKVQLVRAVMDGKSKRAE